MGNCCSWLGPNKASLNRDRPSIYLLESIAAMPEVEEWIDESGEIVPEIPVAQQGVSLEFLEWFLHEFNLKMKPQKTCDVVADIVLDITRKSGSTLGELLIHEDSRGPATHLASHPWNNNFHHTIDAVVEHCTEWESKTNSKAFVWFDIFALNQHKMAAQVYGQDEIKSMLLQAVNQTDETIACLYPWNKPVYIERVWCLYEAHHTLVTTTANKQSNKLLTKMALKASHVKNRKKLKFILCADARQGLEAVFLGGEDTMDEVVSALANFDVKKASAFKIEDKKMILEQIESSFGGSSGLNESVARSLRVWLLESATEMLEKYRRIYSFNEPKLALLLRNYGRLLGEISDDLVQTSNAFEEALSIDRSFLELAKNGDVGTFRKEELNVAADLHLIGHNYYMRKEFRKALERFQLAETIYESSDSMEYAVTLTRMGPTYLKLGDSENGIKALRKAVSIIDSKPDTRQKILRLAEGKPADTAESAILQMSILKLRVQELGPEHPDVARSWASIAELDASQGKHQEASDKLKKSFDICRKIYGEDHPRSQEAHKSYVSSLAAHTSWKASTMQENAYVTKPTFWSSSESSRNLKF